MFIQKKNQQDQCEMAVSHEQYLCNYEINLTGTRHNPKHLPSGNPKKASRADAMYRKNAIRTSTVVESSEAVDLESKETNVFVPLAD